MAQKKRELGSPLLAENFYRSVHTKLKLKVGELEV
jgi:hypothetical protein